MVFEKFYGLGMHIETDTIKNKKTEYSLKAFRSYHVLVHNFWVLAVCLQAQSLPEICILRQTKYYHNII